jgi:hypothetical protein
MFGGAAIDTEPAPTRAASRCATFAHVAPGPHRATGIATDAQGRAHGEHVAARADR